MVVGGPDDGLREQLAERVGSALEVKLLSTPVQVGTTPPLEGRQRGVPQPSCDLGKITGIVYRCSVGSCEEPWPAPCQADDRHSKPSGLRDHHRGVVVKAGEQEDVCV